MDSAKHKYLLSRVIYFSILLLIIFISCNKSDAVVSPDKGNFFQYTAFASSGTTVAQGWLFMKLQNNLVSGEWETQRIGQAEHIGPQTGRGALAGGYSGDSLWVDLQPQMRDNNLLLQGCLKNNTYSGKWIYISFIGPASMGTFTAKEKLW